MNRASGKILLHNPSRVWQESVIFVHEAQVVDFDAVEQVPREEKAEVLPNVQVIMTAKSPMPVQFFLYESDLAGIARRRRVPGPIQLYIDENDLRGMPSDFGGRGTPDEPIYLYLFIDERDLAGSFPVEPTWITRSPPQKTETTIKKQQLVDEAPVVGTEEVLQPTLMVLGDLPEVVEYIIESESTIEAEPIVFTYDSNEPESLNDPEIDSEPVQKRVPSKLVEKTVMSENASDKIKLSPVSLSAEHAELLLASVDLEKDQSTDLSPDSPYARICRRLESLPTENPCPIVVISAMKPEDLSPRFAVNLGLAMVTRKLKVLLVAADSSSQDLAAVFEVPAEPGFFEFRRGEIWASKAVSETMIPDLSFMASGIASPEQSSNQMEQQKEGHRWSNLRRSYDMILLIGPTALSLPPTEPDRPAGSQLLDMADGVLSVSRISQPTEGVKLDIPNDIRQVEKVLSNRHAQNLGLIVLS